MIDSAQTGPATRGADKATVPARSRVTSLDFAPAAFESGDGRSDSEPSVTGRAKARVTLWQLLTCACSVRRKQLFRLPAASIVCRTRALLWLCAFLQSVCCFGVAFDREGRTASAVAACGRLSESAVRASTLAQLKPQRSAAPISNHCGRIRHAGLTLAAYRRFAPISSSVGNER